MNLQEDILRELQKEKEFDRFKEIEKKINKIYDYISNKDLESKEPDDLPQDNLTKMSKKQNFSNLNPILYSDIANDDISPRENFCNTICIAEEFIVNWDKDECRNLIFFGGVGTGKTYMANCIANEVVLKGYTVRSYTILELLDFVSEALMVDRKSNLAEYKMLTNCDLLIIDDLGMESRANFTSNQLFKILDNRMSNMKKTIICTNLSIVDIRDEYSYKLLSRILDTYRFVKFIGNDLRWDKLTK